MHYIIVFSPWRLSRIPLVFQVLSTTHHIRSIPEPALQNRNKFISIKVVTVGRLQCILCMLGLLGCVLVVVHDVAWCLQCVKCSSRGGCAIIRGLEEEEEEKIIIITCVQPEVANEMVD